MRDVGPGEERFGGVEIAEAVEGPVGRRGQGSDGRGGVGDEVLGGLWAVLGVVALHQDAGTAWVEELGVDGPVVEPARADPAALA